MKQKVGPIQFGSNVEGLEGIMCDRKNPMHPKSKIYHFYDFECWPMIKRLEWIFHTTEMKMLRWFIKIINLMILAKAKNAIVPIPMQNHGSSS